MTSEDHADDYFPANPTSDASAKPFNEFLFHKNLIIGSERSEEPVDDNQGYDIPTFI